MIFAFWRCIIDPDFLMWIIRHSDSFNQVSGCERVLFDLVDYKFYI